MSFTSGKTSHDPMPYVWPNLESRLTSGPLRSMFSHGDGIALTYAPRPEFDNHNPILVAFRESRQLTHLSCPDMADLWVETERTRPWTDYGTPEQIDHARRVLDKLASLSEVA